LPPAKPETVRLEVPDEVRRTLVGFRAAVMPEGETVEVKAIVPVNPLMLPSWICEVPDAPR